MLFPTSAQGQLCQPARRQRPLLSWCHFVSLKVRCDIYLLFKLNWTKINLIMRFCLSLKDVGTSQCHKIGIKKLCHMPVGKAEAAKWTPVAMGVKSRGCLLIIWLFLTFCQDTGAQTAIWSLIILEKFLKTRHIVSDLTVNAFESNQCYLNVI